MKLAKKYFCVDIRVLVAVQNAIWEDYTRHVSLHVAVPYPVAITVTFPVQMNVLYAHSPVETIAIIVGVVRNVANLVSPVWKIVSGNVGIINVLNDVVRCVIVPVVIFHALST